ncbi:hypothetical protein [Parasitella parasitica]|uniref:Uncharacterized protein n=1 Tax=Parasitella parasitica TaxID=35722 RepID=A0A0B7MPX5_9FUNG|nr:hypothetical protein [Parasitella parasitica]
MTGSTRVNDPASLTTSATSTRSKATTENDESYMDALRLQFEHRIVKSISDCQKNKGSFEELYSKLANIKQLPRGVVSGAEQAIDASVNSIVVFLNRLTRNTPKKSIEFWKEYLDKNFTSLKDSIVTQEAEGNQEMMEDDEDETTDDEKAEESTAYRSCSASFTSIIRKDLSKNVRLAFVDTINKTVESAFDYIADFSKQIMKILLLFKDNQFTIENGKIQFVPREPYMASRDTYHQFSQQVPFLFMTNQVLYSLGYLNRVVKFTPVIKPTSLHALWVDPTTLYSLFCAQKLERKMVLYNFEGNIIRAASVTSQKDAIFSSFFDIDRLKTVCAGSGLQFAHRIHILPGLQCVRILGFKDYQQPKNKQQEQQRPVDQTSSGSDDKGNDMIAALVEQKAVIQRKLKNAQTALNNYLVSAESASQLKKKWKDENRNRAWLYQRIEEAKQRKRHLIRDVVSAKQELSTMNNAIYKLKHDADPSTKNKQSGGVRD